MAVRTMIRLALTILWLLLGMVPTGFGQNLELRGTLALPNCTAVEGLDGMALVAHPGTLSVVSVLDPDQPVLLGQTTTGTGAVNAVAANGALVYGAASASGLLVVNIANPAEPVVVRTYALGSSAQAVAVRDTLVVVGTPNYVALIGVRNPGSPHLLANYGRAATWLEFEPVLQKVHASGPTGAFSLNVVRHISGGDTTLSLAIDDQYGSEAMGQLAVAGPYVDVIRQSTLIALRAENYTVAGQRQATALLRAVTARDNRAFVALATGTVEYLNQSQDTPALVGAATLPGSPTGLAMAQSGSQGLVVACHNTGLSVLVYDAAPAPELRGPQPGELAIAAYPNPLNAVTELRLTVPRPGTYELAIYDMLGREVERDVLALAGTGTRRVDFAGRAAGLYFARLSGADGAQVLRLHYVP